MISTFFITPAPLHMRVASKIVTQINSPNVLVVNHTNAKSARSNDAMELLLLGVNQHDLLEFTNLEISHDALVQFFY